MPKEQTKLKTLSKHHSQNNTLIQCPHCSWQWEPGHYTWSAFRCVECGMMVDKVKWLVVEED